MNAEAVTGIIIAAVAVLGSLLAMGGITYRMGQIVGKVETMMKQKDADHARLERDIVTVDTALAEHERWHRGTYRTGG